MVKKLLSLIFVLVMMLSLIPASFAWQADAGDYIGADIPVDEAISLAQQRLDADEGKDLAVIAAENNAIVWHYNQYGETVIPEPVLDVGADESFDDMLSKLFEKYNVTKDISNEYRSHISFGYLNLVTGEEHYYGEDTSLFSASIFKIPLNMIMCDRIANGEMNYDTDFYGEPYKFLQYRTISRSDNDRAMTLQGYLGGFVQFKKLLRPYVGDEPYGEDEFIDAGDIKFNPKEVIFALKSVYNDQEKYNGIIQNMLQAQPYEYFKMFQRDYPVAQKYGFFSQTEPTGEHTYINCCGIVYTEEPIAIVCMTDNISKAYDVIGEYACVAAKYTEQQILKEVPEPEPTPEAVETPEVKPAEVTPAPQIEQTNDTTGNEPVKEKKMSLYSCIVIGLILVVMLYFLVAVFRRNAGGKVYGVWTVIAIVIASLAMILCVIASQRGTLYAKPEGDPGETINKFFTSLKGGDYESAYACLEDYSDLGLSKDANTAESKLMQDALRQSYDYALKGMADVDKLSARQTMMFRYLDLNAVEEEAKNNVEDCLKELVAEKSRAELYDENGQFRSEITDEVYNMALERALESPESFYKTVEMTLDLDYINGNWMIKTSDELLSFLLGGVSK